MDGEIIISQSNAILRHIGRKYGLYGSTEGEHCRIDEYLDGIQALRGKYLDLVYRQSLVRFRKPSVLAFGLGLYWIGFLNSSLYKDKQCTHDSCAQVQNYCPHYNRTGQLIPSMYIS